MCASCVLYDVYSAIWKPGNTRQMELVAEWREYGGLAIHTDLMPNTQRGFNGRVLKIGTNWVKFYI